MSEADATLVWLVTGASSGLGLALVKRILARGDRVVATARTPAKFDPYLADPSTDRTRVKVLGLDVTDTPAALQSVAQKAVEAWGRIDVLVNNAGTGGEVGPSEELGTEWMMHVMRTNYAGTVGVTNAFLPHMRGRGSGTVVIIGSRSGYRNEFLGPAAYAASKAAVHSYGETLSAEVAPFGLRVLIVVPGQFRTDLDHPIAGTPIPAYDGARAILRRLVDMAHNAPNQGDPSKGMDALVDVVRGEGRAAGKDGVPLWLYLGNDSFRDVRLRAAKMQTTAEAWESVGSRVGEDDG